VDPEASAPLEVGADGQDGRVLHRRYDQLVAALALQGLAQRRIVRLGGAGGENDLVCMFAAEQGLHLSPRRGDRLCGCAAVVMAR